MTGAVGHGQPCLLEEAVDYCDTNTLYTVQHTLFVGYSSGALCCLHITCLLPTLSVERSSGSFCACLTQYGMPCLSDEAVDHSVHV